MYLTDSSWPILTTSADATCCSARLGSAAQPLLSGAAWMSLLRLRLRLRSLARSKAIKYLLKRRPTALAVCARASIAFGQNSRSQRIRLGAFGAPAPLVGGLLVSPESYVYNHLLWSAPASSASVWSGDAPEQWELN